MFARIENGLVREIFAGDVLPEFHPSLIWVGCSENVREGWRYDGQSFFSLEELIPLSEVKEKRKSEVSALRDQKYRDGFVYGGQVFQIDVDAQKDMLSVQMQFSMGNVAAYDGYWMDAQNQPKAMSVEEVGVFFQAAFSFVKNVKGAAWGHKAAIDSLEEKSQVLSYDISTGWP